MKVKKYSIDFKFYGTSKLVRLEIEFSSTENIMPSLIERLQGTPIRLREKMKTIVPSLQVIKPEGKWSMLEHRAASMTSTRRKRVTRTTEAGHNNTSLNELLSTFEKLRHVTLARLVTLGDDDIFRSVLHPRLKTPMRTIDLFTFVAEHDDHHLARMTEIRKAYDHTS